MGTTRCSGPGLGASMSGAARRVYLEPSALAPLAGLVPPQSARAGVIATARGAQIRSCSA
jgi:hypothetical protein